MGVVWKAFDTKLSRPIALKVLPAELTADPERRRRFLREARAAAAVTHPNIATIHEIDEAGGVVFIAMEYVEGKTLRAVLLGRSLPVREAVYLVAQVAEGLARAHQGKVIHRDLKPENLMVDLEGHVKILDFGLAKLLGEPAEAAPSQLSSMETITREMTREGRVLGTVPYMSPEQARGVDVDARSDLFSFGTVLYEMVTGLRPFRGTTSTDTVNAIINQQPVPAARINGEVPAELERILGKCLEKEPGDRYQDSRDLVVDLRGLVRELESGAVPSYGQMRKARAPARRPRRLAFIMGAAVLVVGGALLALLVLRPGRPAPAPATPAHARSGIAVLPFENMSAGGEHAYFAGGLHEELLTQLAKVEALKVISRTSVMGYRETTKPLRAIAEELGVGSVVEGSVQVMGGRLRVNVQLIDAATDEHLWAERYDRTLEDAFAIQSDIAQQIVRAVGAALTTPEHEGLTAAPTGNAEAYQFYLQGRSYWARPGSLRENVEAAQKLFEWALGLDPDFALAHAALADVHGVMLWYKYDPSPARAERQREEAESALRLAPDLPQAHMAMGRVHYWGRRDYRRALEEFAMGLKGLPSNAELWGLIGYVHRRLGHWDEVFAALEKATKLDPRNADLVYDLGGWTYGFLHRYADAIQMCDRALTLAPDLHEAAIGKGWTYIRWQGRLDTLRAELSRLPSDAQLARWGNLATQRAALLLLERDADGLLQMLHVAHVDVLEDSYTFLPTALYAAWAHQLRGEEAAARAAFDAALARLDSAARELPDDERVHAARGMAMAGLGRRDEALREARWLQDSAIYREDAVAGPRLAEDRARVLAQVGESAAGLDEIERLLAEPSGLTVHTLRLDPRWDPIRDHPRFKALLAKYGSGASL